MSSYKLNDEKMFADVTDGVAILINFETGVYYGMNKLGTAIYENLNKGITAEKILEKLKTFDGFSEEKFNDFIKMMTEKNLMVEAEDVNNSEEVELDEETAKEEEFIPVVNEYLDAQELLLADPIHEVKEYWSPEKDSLNEDKEEVARKEAKMNEDN